MARRRPSQDGSIFFHEGKGLWIAKITLPDGSRKEKSSKRQGVVKEWLQTSLTQVREGSFVKDGSITVSGFLNSYMENVAKHNLRTRTFESYQYLLKMHILPSIGTIKLVNLRPDHLQALYAKKLESGLSKRTVQFMHSVIHKALRQALRWGMVHKNVADLVEAPKPSKPNIHLWTPEQVNIFLTSAKESKYYVLYLLAIYCGFRKSEVLGIHVKDVDLVRGTITVNHTVQISKNGVYLSEPKTESSRRTVTVPKDALEQLRIYVNQLNKDQPLLFMTSNGNPVSPPNIVRMFKDEVRKAGLPKIRFHDLRHFHVSALIMAGASAKAIQSRVGHSQIATTMDIYGHLFANADEDTAERFNKLLTPPITPP